jgi:TIR domain
MTYTVYCIQDDREMWVRSLRDGLGAAVVDLGDSADTIRVLDSFPLEEEIDATAPAVVVYLGSPGGAGSAECSQQIDMALAAGLVVLPCVDSLANFVAHTPEGPLRRFNGIEWSTQDVPPPIVHFVLEALGLEERQRLVFLSHRRSDALALTEQLHDGLIKSRFWPFVDRFDIIPAEDVQKRIYAALEETAFVVLVESPEATLSSWVLEEVHYALRESLGMLIVSFPETAPLAGTEGLPRFYLDANKLTEELVDEPETGRTYRTGQLVLKTDALGELLQEIETIHAKALVRRRRRLAGHTRIAVQRAGLVAVELPGDVLLVMDPGADGAASDNPPPRSLVRFAPRPPQPGDLYAVDSARVRLGGQQTEAVLVHAMPQLPQDASDLLKWCQGDRKIILLADHLVGTHWM